MTMRSMIGLALSSAVCVSTAMAGGGPGLHDMDVGVFVVDSAIQTGRVEESVIVEARVFASDIVLFFGFPFSSDPGFDTTTGVFPAFSAVRLNLLDALRVWENDNFESVATMDLGNGPEPMQVEVSFGQTTVLSSTTPDTLVNGPTFGVSGLGDIHVHPSHVLPQDSPEGLYLMKFELESNAGLETSAPFWFIYDWNADPADLAMAIDWVESNLIGGGIPGDLNGDGVVDGADLAALLAQWGSDGAADLNDDGIVDGADLATLLANWS